MKRKDRVRSAHRAFRETLVLDLLKDLLPKAPNELVLRRLQYYLIYDLPDQ